MGFFVYLCSPIVDRENKKIRKTMNITFDNPDKVKGTVTITLEKGDYQPELDKTLKSYRKRAAIPGFRPGQAPMGMIQRQFGLQAKMDIVNHMVGQQLYDYINKNNIEMLGEPQASESHEPVDIEKDETMTFAFDIAIAPEFSIELSKDDEVECYVIPVTDEQVEAEIGMQRDHFGQITTAETFDITARDMLYGDLRELDAEGNTLEGGITEEHVALMPTYFGDEEQKKLFDGATLGAVITFTPSKALNGEMELANILHVSKEEAAEKTGEFTYQVTEITHFAPAEMNQEFFDKVYGEGVVSDEAAFRAKIAEELGKNNEEATINHFQRKLEDYIMAKVGTLTYADDILKKFMLGKVIKDGKNEEEAKKYVEEEYDNGIKGLTWELTRKKLLKAYDVKIEPEEFKGMAKAYTKSLFQLYGMSNAPEEYITNYAEDFVKKADNAEMIAKMALDRKLTKILKDVVTLTKKEVSVEEFNKLEKGK